MSWPCAAILLCLHLLLGSGGRLACKRRRACLRACLRACPTSPTSLCRCATPPLPSLPPLPHRPAPPPAAARLARHASLERFRLKKARRALAGGGRKIRYAARKVNADKRIRVKVGIFCGGGGGGVG